ncbi:Berberine bridge enzyme-like [Thalictrum thalictroides]|uniref:Berberine bridge enzyme-like n=1 Tax=Thalictrum thalictroides TaxID=46969 RepID=A0A7J6V4R6_THATH|nr:Berberine bridge enzyme-like [Thalictrum thalictroides]
MGFTFTSLLIHISLFASILSSASTAASSTSENFIKCLSKNSADTSTSIRSIVYSPTNSSYTSILEFSIQNFRFISPTTPKPQFIITPTQESHIQAAVICSKKYDYLIRVRSGGHDYEGLSYISYKPFIIIDLFNFQEINVNIKDNTAWVQAGATVGQVYYRIAEQSSTHGFSAGVCPPMGVGGHIGGGGIGFLMRKYGLAADNILDAYFIDVHGKLLNRKSMGEDLFWAIRGGGGASFGVIVAWKIQLVPVPPIVTVFNVERTLEQGATNLFYKWQNSAHKFHEDLLVRTIIQAVNGENGGKTIQIVFQSVYQGTIKELLPLMQKSFPELGLESKDCAQMSWINSTLNVAGLSGQPLEALLNRSQQSKNYFKNKSDFVKKAITPTELESLWKFLLEETEISSPVLITEPFGGKMAKISESAIPFPHRAGNLYNIQYVLTWGDGSATTRSLDKSRRLYYYMTPYVSKSPRAAYVNYKDLDLGMNKDMNTSFMEASVWGEKYFKANFVRLSFVKKKVDPGNFFWNEQSIPPFQTKWI